MSDVSITSIKGIQGQFYLALEADLTAQWPMEIGMMADSSRVGEDYPHLDDVPMMEKTSGGRNVSVELLNQLGQIRSS